MRRNAEPAPGIRLALMVLLAAAAALVVPSALTAESPSSVLVASLALALALAVVVQVAGLVAVPSLFAPGRAPAETAETPLHRPGRITDPVHHPIRARAPGF